MTLEEYFWEYFSNLYYFIHNLNFKGNENIKEVQVSCALPVEEFAMRRGIAAECLKRQLKHNEDKHELAIKNTKRFVDSIVGLSTFEKDELNPPEKSELSSFFNDFEAAVNRLEHSNAYSIIQTVHKLRHEL